jgi:hypothetical protein
LRNGKRKRNYFRACSIKLKNIYNIKFLGKIGKKEKKKEKKEGKIGNHHFKNFIPLVEISSFFSLMSVFHKMSSSLSL